MGPSSSQLRPAAAFLLGLVLLPGSPALAQELPGPNPYPNLGLVVRDGTLGSGPAEHEVVGPGLDPLGQWADYLISPEMGALRGGNLFHSFWSFGIGSGETATFTGPELVEHVIAGVSGPDPSPIDGRLRSTIPGADVWLFNPHGMVFGAGARIDVQGSFHAGAADYVGFEGGLEAYYADGRPSSVLATAPPAAFGFLPENGGAASLSVAGGLEVTRGEAELLPGGDVLLAGAELIGPGAQLGFEAAGEVRLTDGSLVDVGGEAPGTVSIRGGQIVIEQDSQVLAENEGAGPGGRIEVAAGESVLLDNGLLSVNTSAAGDAGTIAMTGDEIVLRNGPGLVDINKPADHRDNLPHEITVGARAETTGSGDAGRIEIEAGSLLIEEGAGLSAQTVGAVGDDGVSADASGNGGTVRIAGAESVTVEDRGFVSVDSWASRGDAGTIQIGDVGALTVDGNWVTTLTASSLGSRSRLAPPADGDKPAFGNGGTITITDAGPVMVLNGGLIQSDCFDCVSGKRAGSVRIEAESLRVKGVGTPLDPGGNPRKRFGIGSNVSAFALAGAGDAGSIDIELTGSLELLEGADIAAGAFAGAKGSAGVVSVKANDVTIDVTKNGARGTGIFAHAGAFDGGAGEAGEITIEANSLHLNVDSEPGAFRSFITAATGGKGEGGSVTIDVRGGDLKIGSNAEISTETTDAGNAGDITITNAGEFMVGDGGLVTSSTRGEGNGGNITLENASSVVIGNGGVVTSRTSGEGKGGNITLEDAGSVVIGGGGVITSDTTGTGDAGNVSLSADSLEIQTGGVITTTSRLGGGDAGNIQITANDWISLTNVGGDRFDLPGVLAGTTKLSGIFSASVVGGAAGSITLVAPEISVTDGAIVASSTIGGGLGGAVELHGDRLRVANGGFVDTSSGDFLRSGGKAGDVGLEAQQWIEVGGADRFGDTSRVSSASLGEMPGAGDAGLVRLLAPRIVLRDGGRIETNAAVANGGDIAIQAQRLVHLDAGEITASVGGGTGGNIAIDPVFVILQNGSRIRAEAGAGSGGQIRITADNFFQFPGSEVSVRAGNPELSGTVEIKSPDVNLAGTLAPLPSTFLDAASLLRERCAARRGGERAGSFAVRGPGGIPAEPDGWLPAPLLPEAAATTATAPPPPVLLASLPGPLLASGACP